MALRFRSLGFLPAFAGAILLIAGLSDTHAAGLEYTDLSMDGDRRTDLPWDDDFPPVLPETPGAPDAVLENREIPWDGDRPADDFDAQLHREEEPWDGDRDSRGAYLGPEEAVGDGERPFAPPPAPAASNPPEEMAWNGDHPGAQSGNQASQFAGPAAGEPEAPCVVFPNPSFANMTFQMGSGGVSVSVFDVTGREITSVDGEHGRVGWDGNSASGSSVAPGVYFARVLAESDGARTVETVRIVRR